MDIIHIKVASFPVIEKLVSATLGDDIFGPEDMACLAGMTAHRRKTLTEHITTVWQLSSPVFRRRIQFITPGSLIEIERIRAKFLNLKPEEIVEPNSGVFIYGQNTTCYFYIKNVGGNSYSKYVRYYFPGGKLYYFDCLWRQSLMSDAFTSASYDVAVHNPVNDILHITNSISGKQSTVLAPNSYHKSTETFVLNNSPYKIEVF